MTLQDSTGVPRDAGRPTLLMVSPYFPPVLGGLEQYVLRLAGKLQQRHNWRVVVATSGDLHGKDRCEVVNDLFVYRLGYGMTVSHTPLGVRWLRRLREIIERENPDIVDAHLPVPGLADVATFAVRDIPLVVTYHSASMRKGKILYDIPIWGYERILGRALLSKAARIICTSTAARDFLQHYQAKSVVIPPSVDTKIFRPASDGPGQRLLFVSNLAKTHAHKGLGHLLEALADPRCREIGLDVVGDGDGRADYEAQCAQLGIADRVYFHGLHYGEALAERYRAAYALVQPSTNDSMPTTIIEAMASGIPVIASRIGSTSTVVRPGATGFLVPPGDVGALTAAILDLYSDPVRAAEYGKAALVAARSGYTTEQQADRTAALFEQLVSGSAKPKGA
jgi:glycosyltransferase involved in cell wall biosynthesis